MGFSQNSTVEGNIADKNNNPLIGVNLYLKKTTQGSQSDENGYFKIDNLAKGDYVIVISYLGYKTKEVAINVPSNQVVDMGKITLLEGNELLQQIVVTSSRRNKFSRKNTAYVSKLPLQDMENSQTYSTITTELLESQIVTNFDDAINNATGISKLWESTGRAPGEGTGYFSTRGYATQPALVDGLPGFTFSAIDPSYIERIEVIKGPSATLFGSTVTSLGGLINVVTKKPYEGFGGSVSYTAGSFGLHRVSADLNTPLNRKDNLFFRMNASYLTQGSFQDAGSRETYFIAPSLTYRVNNRLNLSLGIEYSSTEQTNPSMLFVRRGIPMVSNNIEELGIDPEKSFTSNDVTLSSPILNTRAIADFKISDQWNSQTILASTHSETKGYYQYMIEGAGAAFGVLAPLAATPYPPLQEQVNEVLFEANQLLSQDVFTRIYDKRDADGTKANFQQNLIGDFNLGKVRNRMVIGLDYVYREQSSRNRNGNPLLAQNSNFPFIIETLNTLNEGYGDVIAAQLSGLPYFDGFFSANGDIVPTSFTPNTTYTVSKANLDAIFSEVPIRDINTGSQTYAAYISDVVSLTKNLTINLGLRLDHFDQDGEKSDPLDDYTKTTLSPNAGILYQAIAQKLSLFANYQTGFINNDPVVNNDGTVDTFDPTEAKQFEGGIKTNLFRGKLNAGISYYLITVNNSINSDPNGVLFPLRINLAETVNKGFEFEVNANPFEGLNIRASYSLNNSEITDAYSSKTDIVYDALQGRRPEEAGPENIYNLWADFKFGDKSFFKNFGIGAGLNGASEHLMMNNAVSGVFTLPGYTIYNATIYYNADKYRIGLKVNNMSDEIYYKGWSTVNGIVHLTVSLFKNNIILLPSFGK
ncbi:TonB-dependent receptor [Membranihabitans marinus]